MSYTQKESPVLGVKCYRWMNLLVQTGNCGAFSPSKDATVDLLSIINELHMGCLSHRGNLTLQSIATVVTGEIDYLTVGSN